MAIGFSIKDVDGVAQEFILEGNEEVTVEIGKVKFKGRVEEAVGGVEQQSIIIPGGSFLVIRVEDGDGQS